MPAVVTGVSLLPTDTMDTVDHIYIMHLLSVACTYCPVSSFKIYNGLAYHELCINCDVHLSFQLCCFHTLSDCCPLSVRCCSNDFKFFAWLISAELSVAASLIAAGPNYLCKAALLHAGEACLIHAHNIFCRRLLTAVDVVVNTH